MRIRYATIGCANPLAPIHKIPELRLTYDSATIAGAEERKEEVALWLRLILIIAK
ncbi:MAG: hypothetical protein V4485_06010 [Pseudomonadota bacterium]